LAGLRGLSLLLFVVNGRVSFRLFSVEPRPGTPVRVFFWS
jgi:hypothetical protein